MVSVATTTVLNRLADVRRTLIVVGVGRVTDPRSARAPHWEAQVGGGWNLPKDEAGIRNGF